MKVKRSALWAKCSNFCYCSNMLTELWHSIFFFFSTVIINVGLHVLRIMTRTWVTCYTLWLTEMPSQKWSRSHFVHQTPWGEILGGDGRPCFILTVKNTHLSERSFDTPLSPTLYKYFGLVVFEWSSQWVSSFVSIIIASCLKLLFQTEIAGPLFFKNVISWDPLRCDLTDGHYWSFIVNCLLGAQIYSLFFQIQDDSVYLRYWMQMHEEACPVGQGCEEEQEEAQA